MTRLSIRLVNASIHRRRSSVSPVSLKTRISGADASGGNTRSHPEHDREEPDGRKYYAGDGMGGQAGARSWGCSSVGRAPALQAGGQEFESLHLHSEVMTSVNVP